MQFVENGPDVPETLLQAHEDGRVVFFCGAGISYPAKLPDFKGLVTKIYESLNTDQSDIEQQAFERGQYDATLDLLERRIPGNRTALRKALAKNLEPNLRLKGATDTHKALLQLGRDRQGNTRLVTTNFDRVFERINKRNPEKTQTYAAPLLPIPKKSRWDGLVYLHGLLPEKSDPDALNKLVLTSGDFGLAYLTERWAARFVGELFRNYIVCFVGYSINDPVLRYMMDALAADRMLGETTHHSYAFGSFSAGDKQGQLLEWEAKGVSPILYEVPQGSHDHSLLHDTLASWAETYRDGVQAKEGLVAAYAMSRPLASTEEDDFVGRMLWALTHSTGLPAKRFAELDPVPTLDWLEPLSDKTFGHSDLRRFGVASNTEPDDKLQFSITQRPWPYRIAPKMALVSTEHQEGQLDAVMYQLARWLVRHLGDPALLLWFVKQGDHLHNQVRWLIEHRLSELADIEQRGDNRELERIRASARKAIPSEPMRAAWNFLLTSRLKFSIHHRDLYRWKDELKRRGLTPLLRLELRDILSPKIAINRLARTEDVSESDVTRLRELFDWDLVLASEYTISLLPEMLEAESFRVVLPDLLIEFQQLLSDALALCSEAGEAEYLHDRSTWDLPSISPHWQNRDFQDWVALVHLLRESWIETSKNNPLGAREIASNWFGHSFPVFKRIALFAATHSAVFRDNPWVGWLSVDEAWWLWSVETKREVLRLFVLRGANLPQEDLAVLEGHILVGPPKEMFREDLADAEFARHSERMVWLHLAKLISGGVTLGIDAASRFKAISSRYPDWKLSDDERDEFSVWMSGTGDPGYESSKEVVNAPTEILELRDWLKRPVPDEFMYEDNWRSLCQDKYSLAAEALSALAEEGFWPIERWREALQTWRDEKWAQESWEQLGSIIKSMPEDIFSELSRNISDWIDQVAQKGIEDEELFLEVCDHLFCIDYGNIDQSDQTISSAINHPIGITTGALLKYWGQKDLRDGQKLHGEIRRIFTKLCERQDVHYRLGRIILSSRVVTLFRVDPDWTKANFLPSYSWDRSPAEALAVWAGFLWSPRMYSPLFEHITREFLETAEHFVELGETGRQYASVLAYAALDRGHVFSSEELREAVKKLPAEGLKVFAKSLAQAQESAGDQREQYWQNRVRPVWTNIWPKNVGLISSELSNDLARLVIAAGDSMPDALELILPWLKPIEHSGFVVNKLDESGLCIKYPKKSLTLLHAIVSNPGWHADSFRSCLDGIAFEWEGASNDHRYTGLREAL